LKYGGIEHSDWEVVGDEDDIPEEDIHQDLHISTNRESRKVNQKASKSHLKDMNMRARLRLNHEQQVKDKHMALWLDLQKEHKAIAACRPRGTYWTTWSDYWLDVFIMIFPHMPDDERAARLQAIEALGDGTGWNAKWPSLVTVKAYKPAKAEMDAKIWVPVFMNLTKNFEGFLPNLVDLPTHVQPIHLSASSQPIIDASP
jgi:hypothetical protein